VLPSARAFATNESLTPLLNARGVRIGGSGRLALTGCLTGVGSGHKKQWWLEEVTDVRWTAGLGATVIEHRKGHLRLVPVSGGPAIDISTGPVAEVIDRSGSDAILASQGGCETAMFTAGTVSPSDAWSILDNPDTASLPAGLSEYRVFRRTPDRADQRAVFWSLRSPWHPALSTADSGYTLLWRASGSLTITEPEFAVS
jgi:hypothetical protein